MDSPTQITERAALDTDYHGAVVGSTEPVLAKIALGSGFGSLLSPRVPAQLK